MRPSALAKAPRIHDHLWQLLRVHGFHASSDSMLEAKFIEFSSTRAPTFHLAAAAIAARVAAAATASPAAPGGATCNDKG